MHIRLLKRTLNTEIEQYKNSNTLAKKGLTSLCQNLFYLENNATKFSRMLGRKLHTESDLIHLITSIF